MEPLAWTKRMSKLETMGGMSFAPIELCAVAEMFSVVTVSYTHLTLPTNREV